MSLSTTTSPMAATPSDATPAPWRAAIDRSRLAQLLILVGIALLVRGATFGE